MKLLIVDDQALIRDGLVTICERLPDVDVVGTAGDGEQAPSSSSASSRRTSCSWTCGCRGWTASKRPGGSAQQHPETQVVVLTTFSDDESVIGALAAGALGYLTKDAGREDIRRALEAAARGQALLDPAVHARLIQLARQQPAGSGDGGAARRAHRARGRGPRATSARGLSNHEIAATLYRQRGDGEDPHQPHLRQDPQPRPRPSRRLCPPARPRVARSALRAAPGRSWHYRSEL